METLHSFSEGKQIYRPAPFWSWNDQLNPGELRAQMIKMKNAGYGGFFMHSRVGLITRYLSDEWMELVRLCSVEGQKLGLDAWLYDEDMWPSGYAGGRVPALSEAYREKALVLIPAGDLRPTDVLWKTVVRDGQAFCIAARTCEVGMVRFNNQCYIDAMNPEAVRAFLDSTHERYKQSMGGLFGQSIRGIFTDEPCYGIHWFYPMPHVPYSEYLRARILDEKGYDIADRCEELFLDIGNYKRTRYDYFTLAGKQLAESYTRQIAAWCEENHLLFTGHMMAEETLYEQAQWTGGVMMNYAYMQQPGVDKLMRHNTQLVTLKQLTSVTEQLGKPRALSECFAGLGHESGFYKRKQIMDWQAVNGINFVNMHLSHYSLRGERKRDYPPDIFYQQPYFEKETLFSDYTARLSQVASYGRRDVRVLILEPLGSVFARYNPADPENQQKLTIYDEYLADLAHALQDAFIDFHLGDESILGVYGDIRGGQLRVGDCEYDTVILCHAESLASTTVELLQAFEGQVLVLGQTPSLCDYRTPVVIRTDGVYDTVDDLVAARADRRTVDAEGKNIIACRRVGEKGESAYLFANTGKTVESLRFPAMKGAYLLDMTNGAAYLADTDTVRLHPYGSMAVFVGSREALAAADIPIRPIPPIYGDGVEVATTEKRPIPTPAARIVSENTLVLDRVDFETADLRLADVPVEALWHYHFYKLPEGTPYTLRYRFFVDSLPATPVQIVIENAENTDAITLNGVTVTPLRAHGEAQMCDEKAYVDLSFTRCLATSLKVGENVLEVRAHKYNNITDVCNHRAVTEADGDFCPTEAEAAYVIGDFALAKSEDGYHITAPSSAPLLGNVAAQGYPFYSGALEYTFDCSLRGDELLRIDCDCTYATLEIDGKAYTAGVVPYIFDTRELKGIFAATLRLYNSLFALLGPHHIRNYDRLIWVDAGVPNDLNRYERNPLVKPYGLKKIHRIYRKEDER